jgi:hypothetical protein
MDVHLDDVETLIRREPAQARRDKQLGADDLAGGGSTR